MAELKVLFVGGDDDYKLIKDGCINDLVRHERNVTHAYTVSQFQKEIKERGTSYDLVIACVVFDFAKLMRDTFPLSTT